MNRLPFVYNVCAKFAAENPGKKIAYFAPHKEAMDYAMKRIEEELLERNVKFTRHMKANKISLGNKAVIYFVVPSVEPPKVCGLDFHAAIFEDDKWTTEKYPMEAI